MLLFDEILLSNLLFNLFECLQEELLNLASLVKDDLGESTHVAQLLVLHSEVFPCVDDLFPLLFNNRLMLVAHHLLFFFEVSNDLRKTFLENLNFVLVGLDLVCLHLSALLILLFCSRVDGDVAFDFPINLLLLLNLLLVLLKLVSLRDGLQCERLVLIVDLTFNRLYGCKHRAKTSQ